jgi:hypothetical protein
MLIKKSTKKLITLQILYGDTQFWNRVKYFVKKKVNNHDHNCTRLNNTFLETNM